MDKEKIKDRIRKCLALAGSPNEHEAAAALRQAQKMMKAHSISEDEVGLTSYAEDFVDHNDYAFARGKKPMTISAIACLMSTAFGLVFVWERSEIGTHRVRYFGPKQNVMMAVHAHTVVNRAVGSAWRTYLKNQPGAKGIRNARASFYYGWCHAVAKQVEDLNPQGDEGARIKDQIAKHYGEALAEAKAPKRTIYRDVLADGLAAGKDFSIRRPLN